MDVSDTRNEILSELSKKLGNKKLKLYCKPEKTMIEMTELLVIVKNTEFEVESTQIYAYKERFEELKKKGYEQKLETKDKESNEFRCYYKIKEYFENNLTENLSLNMVSQGLIWPVKRELNSIFVENVYDHFYFSIEDIIKYIPEANEFQDLKDVKYILINEFAKEYDEYLDKKIIEDTEKFINEFIDETEKEIVVKTRTGQGRFKKKLLTRSKCCEICNLDIQELLIASHCKPWKKSNDKERLDINNGLLLCTLHDSLFDKGFITFDDDGKIIISNKIKEGQYRLLNIDKDIKIKLSESQIPYIEHHRKEEFKN